MPDKPYWAEPEYKRARLANGMSADPRPGSDRAEAFATKQLRIVELAAEEAEEAAQRKAESEARFFKRVVVPLVATVAIAVSIFWVI